MAESPYIATATLENFQTLVMQNSTRVPVLVDFWADWCAPCKVLMPLLEKLAEEYKGAFLLAKVNADQQPELAAHFGVRSLPTVKLLMNGRIVDEFSGALQEKQIRALLDKYVVSEVEKLRRAAATYRERGEPAKALDLLTHANQIEPENHDILVALAQVSAETGDWKTALEICESLPADYRGKPEVKQILAQRKLAEKAGDLPSLESLQARLAANADDAEALHQLSQRQALQNDHEGAIQSLLTLMQKNRDYGDDLARKSLLELFDMLGKDDPLVKTYRRRLYAMLH